MTLPEKTQTRLPLNAKQDAILQKELTLVNTDKFIRKDFTVEKRIWKDVFWYQGWFRNLQPEWSEWVPVYTYDKINNASKAINLLNRTKHIKTIKTEYRLVKK